MLLDPVAAMQAIQGVVGVDDFYVASNQLVYLAILGLYDGPGTVDMVLLHRFMTDAGTLKAAGGLDYLLEIVSSVPSAANVEQYAAIVQKMADRRGRISKAVEMLKQAYNGSSK